MVRYKRLTPRFVDEIYFCVPSLTTQKGSHMAASLEGIRLFPESKVILIRCMISYSGETFETQIVFNGRALTLSF